jgi:hypothetical protein
MLQIIEGITSVKTNYQSLVLDSHSETIKTIVIPLFPSVGSQVRIGMADNMHANRKFRELLLNSIRLIVAHGYLCHNHVLFDVFRNHGTELGMSIQFLDGKRSQDQQGAEFLITAAFIQKVSQHHDGKGMAFLLQTIQDLLSPTYILNMPICQAVDRIFLGLFKLIYMRAYFKDEGLFKYF